MHQVCRTGLRHQIYCDGFEGHRVYKENERGMMLPLASTGITPHKTTMASNQEKCSAFAPLLSNHNTRNNHARRSVQSSICTEFVARSWSYNSSLCDSLPNRIPLSRPSLTSPSFSVSPSLRLCVCKCVRAEGTSKSPHRGS